MADYTYKDESALTYDANKIRLRTEGRLLLARLMNEAIAEMTRQFNDAQLRGELLEVTGNQDQLRELLWAAAQHTLGPGDVDGSGSED